MPVTLERKPVGRREELRVQQNLPLALVAKRQEVVAPAGVLARLW